MDLFDEKIDELLAKYLADECSAEEAETVGRWLAEGPDHQKYLADLQWLWLRSPNGLPPAPRRVDTEAALHQVKIRLLHHGKTAPLRWQRSFWLRAAAVVAIVVAGVYWWRLSQAPGPVHFAATGAALTDTLTDGSVVTLQRASGLTLAPAFNRRERRMRLEGQASFQVTHDTSRPFVVEVPDLEVRVVGTVFTVDDASDPAKVLVWVTEGKVAVRHSNQSLLLTAGEEAVYDRTAGTLSRVVGGGDNQDPSRLRRSFRFDATPLGDVARQIGQAYGVHLSFKNKILEKCPLTARYNNITLERVLEIIADSFSITVETTADEYVLDGKGCGE